MGDGAVDYVASFSLGGLTIVDLCRPWPLWLTTSPASLTSVVLDHLSLVDPHSVDSVTLATHLLTTSKVSVLAHLTMSAAPSSTRN